LLLTGVWQAFERSQNQQASIWPCIRAWQLLINWAEAETFGPMFDSISTLNHSRTRPSIRAMKHRDAIRSGSFMPANGFDNQEAFDRDDLRHRARRQDYSGVKNILAPFRDRYLLLCSDTNSSSRLDEIALL
jgi:hypothetical protein